jgi:drug/metabolite transporter (DMT)-like permease
VTASRPLTGTVLAAAGAFSYGVTIVFNRSLAKAGLGPPTALGLRFTLAGLLLLALLSATGRPLLPLARERRACLVLGLAYAVESTFFFMALERGTAAAVTLLFYAYPAIVTVAELAGGRGRPSGRVLAALALSATGSMVVVVAGAEVSITTAGILLALCSAVAFSLYLMASHRLVGRSDAMTTGAWVALACGLTHLARGALTAGFRSPAGQWPALLGNAVATAAAFSLMFAGLRRLGPARTAVVMTLEAVFGVGLAAAFLHEALRPVQVGGGALVLTGAVLVATSGLRRAAPAAAAAPAEIAVESP